LINYTTNLKQGVPGVCYLCYFQRLVYMIDIM